MAIRTLGLLLLAAAPAPADEARPVSATAPPGNHFHYRLVPDPLDREPGDGAAAYRDCLAAFGVVLRQVGATGEFGQNLQRLREQPIDRFDRAVAAALLRPFARPLELFEKAARHERVDWRKVVTSPDEADRFTSLARVLPDLLRVRARLQMADPEPRDAVRTLALGFRFARHLHDDRLDATSADGYSAGVEMADGLLDVVGHPACPNLYAALTELPAPLFPVRVVSDAMRRVYLGDDDVQALFRDPVGTRLTPSRIERLAGGFTQAPAVRATRLLSRLVGRPAQFTTERHHLGLFFLGRLDDAKAALARRGYAPAVLERMPPLNVGVLDLYATYEETLGQATAALALPYPRASEALRRLGDDLQRQVRADRTGMARVRSDVYFPGELAYHLADGVLNFQRRFEAVRFVEALRLHAHATGRWPDRADDVTAVPLPVDPATGKPFTYRREGDVAVVVSPVLDPPETDDRIVTLRLALRKP